VDQVESTARTSRTTALQVTGGRPDQAASWRPASRKPGSASPASMYESDAFRLRRRQVRPSTTGRACTNDYGRRAHACLVSVVVANAIARGVGAMSATPFRQLTASIRGGTRQGWRITGMKVGELLTWHIVVINAWAPNPPRPTAAVNVQPPLTVTETFTLPATQSHTTTRDAEHRCVERQRGLRPRARAGVCRRGEPAPTHRAPCRERGRRGRARGTRIRRVPKPSGCHRAQAHHR